MTAAISLFDVELSPRARQIGIAYIHDVDLDDGQTLSPGDSVQLRDEGGHLWDAIVVVREDVPRGLGHKYRLRIMPAAGRPTTLVERRASLRGRATWLSQLGLSSDDPPPVEVIEDVAHGALSLLDQVEKLELELAEARVWAWADRHGHLEYAWLSVAGRTYDGDPDQLPDWLVDPRTPVEQEWWPAVGSSRHLTD